MRPDTGLSSIIIMKQWCSYCLSQSKTPALSFFLKPSNYSGGPGCLPPIRPELPIVHFLCAPKENEPKERAPCPWVLRTALCFSPGPGSQKLASLRQFASLIGPFCDARLQGQRVGGVESLVRPTADRVRDSRLLGVIVVPHEGRQGWPDFSPQEIRPKYPFPQRPRRARATLSCAQGERARDTP